MEAIVFTERLNKALLLVSRIISTRNQLPILGNVLLQTQDGNLSLTTTNLETAINTEISAVIKKEGKTTIPAKQLSEITSLIKEEKIKLFLQENTLIIEGKNIRNSLNTMSASEFPPIIKKEGQANFIIKKKEYKKVVNQIAIAASFDEGRPVLGGGRLEKKGEGAELATTDGYRLSVKSLKTEKIEIKNPVIFPVKTLIEVARIAEEQKSEEIRVLLLEEKKQAIFLFEDTEVITRLIEGEFPNYQKIIPPSFITKITADKEELLNAVKISAIYARESANIVKIKIKDKEMTLSANAPQIGENSVVLEVEQDGEDTEVAFNFRFLLDFLGVVEEERVVFETNGPLNPGVFRAEGDNSFFHIIMPVRVQS